MQSVGHDPMGGTVGNDTTNPCLSRRLCQQKAPMHHALDTEGTQVLLWPGLNVENSAPLGGCL